MRWSSITDPSILPPGSSYHVAVHAGQTLYLPPGWWHYVHQAVDQSGICLAVNWWYDMEMQGMSWICLQYMRGTLGQETQDDSDDE